MPRLNKLLFIIAVLMLGALSSAAFAQDDGSPPDQIEAVFADMSQRLREEVNFETIAGFQWAARDFGDTSLGCPDPNQVYTQVVTPGYQFFITYAGETYDYRVSEDTSIVILCDITPAVPSEPTPTPTADDPVPPCGDSYVVTEDDTLIEIAQNCNTSIAAMLNANPGIEDRALIFAGQELAIADEVRAVAIRPLSGPPGTQVEMIASGFPPGSLVEIGLGVLASEYTVVGTREIGPTGQIFAMLIIPPETTIGQEWVAVVVLNNVETISEPFEVTEAPVETTPAPADPDEDPDAALFEQTRVYLVALRDEGRSGPTIGCDDSLVPVLVTFEPTVAPLTAALEELFAVNTRTYGESGLYNALYRSDLSVEGIDINDGLATINLSGELIAGGVCDVPRIESQLRQTALQYSTIDEVEIFINGEPLDDIL
jgi:LysM repeat protein